MHFRGNKEPIKVLHQKADGELKCICGAKLESIGGALIHPPIDPKKEIKRVKEHYGVK